MGFDIELRLHLTCSGGSNRDDDERVGRDCLVNRLTDTEGSAVNCRSSGEDKINVLKYKKYKKYSRILYN